MQTIDVDLPCVRCNYNLRGLSSHPLICPECGIANPPPATLGAITEADIQKRFGRLEGELVALLVIGSLFNFMLIPATAAAWDQRAGGLGCAIFSLVLWGYWIVWASGFIRAWARRAALGSAWVFPLISYAACAPIFWMLALGLSFPLLVRIVAPRATISALHYILWGPALVLCAALFSYAVRPWLRRVRQRMLDTQRYGIIAELQGAPPQNPPADDAGSP